MKKPACSLLSLLLLLPAVLLAGAPPKPNVADYKLLVHVTFSRSVTLSADTHQELHATIDGQEVELTSYKTLGLLRPGDYKAKFLPNLNGSKHPNFYDEFVGYDLLLPDGTTRDFALTGLGRKGDVTSPPR